MDRARTDAGGAEAAPCPEEGCKGRTCTRSGDAAGISETTRQYLALKSPGRGRSPPSAAQAPTEPDHARNRAYLRNTSDDPGKGAGRGHIAPEARAHGPVTVPGVDPHLPEQRLDHRTMQRILQPHRCVVMLPAEQRAYQRELVAALERARGESVHELRAQAREAIERASEERRAQAQSASPRGLQQGGHSPRRRPLTAAHVGASSRARRTTKPRTDAPAGPAGSTKPRGSRKPGRARTRCGGGGVRLWNGRGVYVPVSLDASGPYRPGMMLDLRRFYAVAEPTREERESQFGVVYGEDGAPNEYRPHRRARVSAAAHMDVPSRHCSLFLPSPVLHSRTRAQQRTSSPARAASPSRPALRVTALPAQRATRRGCPCPWRRSKSARSRALLSTLPPSAPHSASPPRPLSRCLLPWGMPSRSARRGVGLPWWTRTQSPTHARRALAPRGSGQGAIAEAHDAAQGSKTRAVRRDTMCPRCGSHPLARRHATVR